MSTLLKSRGLEKSFFLGKSNERQVLKGVDLQIERGEFVSVMGPSGSGKSTLLYTLSGMDRMTSGSVVLGGRELGDLSEEELSDLRLTEMGFVFQHIHLLKNLSIFDNVVLPGYLARNGGRDGVNRRAKRLMERVGIADLRDRDVTQASGGQLQRVGICRALINKPSIVFGDEPTGALNSTSAGEIMDLLADIHRSGTTVLVVTHNVKVAARTERVLFMLDGQIVDEKKLGEQVRDGRKRRAREEALSAWLLERGF